MASLAPDAEPMTTARPSSGRGAGIVAAVLLVAALAAAISVDVVSSGYGVKSDEATYVAMTLSLAYDRDLAYTHTDLERFWGLYHTGPEGIFLKRGKSVRLRASVTPPFFQLTKRDDTRADRLYFGKAFAYSVFAAPFVRLLGMNGFLVFNVLLLGAVCACGYGFLRARSTSAAAMTFTLAFVGASVVPVYAVYLMPDLFNLALVFVAYFFWLYKETRDPGGEPRGIWSDVIAAILLGIATYSKPPNAVLIAPLVLLPWWRRRWIDGAVVGVVFTAVAVGLFVANLAVTGEFNYQGGDRKTFYSAFPFDSTQRDVWAEHSSLTATDDADTGSVLAASEFVGRFAHNVEYFFVGRHFGFVPYFFPGFVALVAWAFSRDRFRAWRVLTVGSLAGATLVWLVIAPYSWSGGGGPPGNRYFLSIYPLVFFLMPPMQTSAAGLLAWVGGALFTAKILVSPFDSAKRTWEIAERGPARRLPVELTMVQDLPAMLAQPPRGLIHYRNDPLMELTFLDAHAWPPDCDQATGQCVGMWVSGGGRADIIVKTEEAVRHFAMTARSPIKTTLTISAGSTQMTVPLLPDKDVSFQLPASGVRGFESYECLLSAQSSDGFIPHLRNPESADSRNLGVLLNFKAE